MLPISVSQSKLTINKGAKRKEVRLRRIRSSQTRDTDHEDSLDNPQQLLLSRNYGIERAMRENFQYEDRINRDALARHSSARDSLLHS